MLCLREWGSAFIIETLLWLFSFCSIAIFFAFSDISLIFFFYFPEEVEYIDGYIILGLSLEPETVLFG